MTFRYAHLELMIRLSPPYVEWILRNRINRECTRWYSFNGAMLQTDIIDYLFDSIGRVVRDTNFNFHGISSSDRLSREELFEVARRLIE